MIMHKLIPQILHGDAKLQLNFFVGIFITTILASFSVGITIYSYSIFLSSYPMTWIPYWMIGESALIFALGSVITIFNPNNFKKYSQLILLGIALLSVISIILIKTNWFWAPFIVVLILRSCSNIMAAAIWSLLPTLFYFRQYKNLLNRFTIASSLGAILAPIIFGTIMVYFGTTLMLLLLIFALIISSIFVNKTSSVTQSLQHQSQTLPPTLKFYKYPLFNTVLIISLILTILYGLGDFLFRAQLGSNLNQEQIVLLMSAFMAVANFLSLLTQLFAPQLFHRFKYYIVLQGVFVIVIFSALAYWINPTIWPAMILASIKIIFDNGLIGIIRRNMINIFPPAIMGKNELYTRTYISATGGIIAGFLALFSTQLIVFLDYLPLLFIILSIAGIIISYTLFKQYLSTLKDMVVISGFSGIQHNQKDIKHIQTLIKDKLKKPQVTPLEISLITPKLFETPPDSLYTLLADPKGKDEIKNTVLKILQIFPHEKLNFTKLNEIYHDRNLLSEEIREKVLKILSNIHSRGLLESARKRLQEEPFSKNALLILLKYGDTDDYLSALKRTLELANGKNYLQRTIAAKLIYTLGSGRFFDLKSKLLTDHEPIVRVAAFHSLPAQDVHQMLPSLGKFLNRNVIKILRNRFSLSEQMHLANRLIELYKNNPDEYALSAIAFITPIPDQHAEQYILDFLKIKNTFYRSSLAFYLINRKMSITFSQDLNTALIEAMKFEIDLITEYKNLYNHPALRKVQLVLDNRINYAVQRFLYWYAALHADTPGIFLTITRLILKANGVKATNEQDKTIEFLMSNEAKHEIIDLMENLFKKKSGPAKILVNKKTPIIFENDEWLTSILNKYTLEESNEMNPLQRAIVLQKTEFFESLPEEVLLELGQSCKLNDYAEDEIIIKEGDEGDCLYVLVEGELWVYKNQNLLATLTPIKCIGEMALFGNTKRTTTVIAKQRSLLLTLSKEDFMILTNEFPQILQNVIKIIIERFSDQIQVLEGKSGAI